MLHSSCALETGPTKRGKSAPRAAQEKEGALPLHYLCPLGCFPKQWVGGGREEKVVPHSVPLVGKGGYHCLELDWSDDE